MDDVGNLNLNLILLKKMITATNMPASTTRSSNNFTANSSMSLRNPLGQENKRPLLHRIFGGKQTTAQPPQSSSVGAVSRGVPSSFLSGASAKLIPEIIPPQSAHYQGAQTHKSQGIS
jgi:hypothetical protein